MKITREIVNLSGWICAVIVVSLTIFYDHLPARMRTPRESTRPIMRLSLDPVTGRYAESGLPAIYTDPSTFHIKGTARVMMDTTSGKYYLYTGSNWITLVPEK